MENEPDLRCQEAAADCVCLNLRKASRAVTQVYDEVLRPAGLRGTQMSLLVALSVSGESPLTRVAEALSMDRTTLTRNLGPLGKRGWVETSRGKDQRTHLLSLTSAGRRVLDKTLPLWAKAQERVLKSVGQSRWAGLREDLSRLRSEAKAG